MGEISKSRRQDLIFRLLKGLSEQSALCPKTIKKRLENEGVQVNLRTIRRDLVELSTSHGLCSTETRPERFYPSHDYELKHELHLNENTLQALLVALNNLKFTSHHYFKNFTTEAETAILDSLDPALAKELRKSKDRYYFDYSTAGKPADSNINDFEKIMQAIRQNKLFSCQNDSPYKDQDYNQRERVFAPYVFLLSSGIPYLVAQDQEDQVFKKLRMTRIKNVRLSDESFVPDDFDNEMNFETLIGGWGGISQEASEIKIVCDRQMATYFQERAIHSTQEVKKLADNKYQITFQCAQSNELARLIASFGGNVKSVEPLALYREVKEIWSSGLKNAA